MDNKPDKNFEKEQSNYGNSESFTEIARAASIYRGIKGLISTSIIAVVAVIFAIVLMAAGIPKGIGIAIIAIAAGIVIIQLIELWRAYSFAYGKTKVKKNEVEVIAVDPDEVLVDYAAGIMRYGLSSGSYSVLGTGENLTPENSLLVTNKNIWAVTVPLEGAGQVISGTDISQWQWMAMQDEIENKLKEMMGMMSLENLIRSSGKHILIRREDIKSFKSADVSQGVIFIMKNGKKYKYSIRKKEDFKRIKISIIRYIDGY